MSTLFLTIFTLLASIQSSPDNLLYSFIVLLDNEYFLISSLHRTFINDTSCPLVIESFLSDITVFLYVFAHPIVLIRWVVAGLEIARLVNEFDEHMTTIMKNTTNVRQLCRRSSGKICVSWNCTSQGHPFLDDGEDLVILDIKLVMDSSVVQNLKTNRNN